MSKEASLPKENKIYQDPKRYEMVKTSISQLVVAFNLIPDYAAIPLIQEVDPNSNTLLSSRDGKFIHNGYEWWVHYYQDSTEPDKARSLDIMRMNIVGEGPKKINGWVAEWDEHLDLGFFREDDQPTSNISYHVSWEPLLHLQYAYGSNDDKAFEGVTNFLFDLPRGDTLDTP